MNNPIESEILAGSLSGWLVRKAACTAPAELSQRLEEEWLADLRSRSTAFSRLRFAVGCIWATRVIAHDHSIASTQVAAPASVTGVITRESRPIVNLLSRRATTLGLVALLHLVVFYAFMTGLSSSLTHTNTPPLQNRVLNEPHTRELPPLPAPTLNRVKLDLPTLDADVTIAADHAPEVIGEEVLSTPQIPVLERLPVMPQPVPTLSPGGPGAGFPSPDEYYPSLSRHLEEQGAATVRVCVDAGGRLTGDPTVVASSGNTRLDDGALKLARAGSGHYRATTENGRAINSCYPFRIRFQIKN